MREELPVLLHPVDERLSRRIFRVDTNQEAEDIGKLPGLYEIDIP
jgi:hypothetical protein